MITTDESRDGQPPKEDDLLLLFEFATGRGRWAWTGPYMHTHPGGDAESQSVHDACVELERRGMLKRCLDDPGHVCWVAATEP